MNSVRMNTLRIFFLFAFYAVAKTESQCGVGEFYLLFDSSSSYKNRLSTLQKLALPLASALLKLCSRSRIGLGAFSDKGASVLGDPAQQTNSTCYQNVLSLSNDAASFKAGVDRLTILDGGDIPESQLDALYYSARSQQVGWSNGNVDGEGREIIRMLIMLTETDYHIAGDAANLGFYPVSQQFQPITDNVTEPECLKYDYPSIAVLTDALRARGILPIFLVSKPSHHDMYQNLLMELGTGGAVVTIAPDLSDLIKKTMEVTTPFICLGGLCTADSPTDFPTTQSQTHKSDPLLITNSDAGPYPSTAVVVLVGAAGFLALGITSLTLLLWVVRVNHSPSKEVQDPSSNSQMAFHDLTLIPAIDQPEKRETEVGRLSGLYV